jgi:hypothetical protein
LSISRHGGEQQEQEKVGEEQKEDHHGSGRRLRRHSFEPEILCSGVGPCETVSCLLYCCVTQTASVCASSSLETYDRASARQDFQRSFALISRLALLSANTQCLLGLPCRDIVATESSVKSKSSATASRAREPSPQTLHCIAFCCTLFHSFHSPSHPIPLHRPIRHQPMLSYRTGLIMPLWARAV